MKKTWLFFVSVGSILPSCIGILSAMGKERKKAILNQHKDPYLPASTMESKKVFFSWLVCFK